MITSLTLDNFKCFEHFYMPLRPLTLIVGTNGAGKSSIIQSMLLLRQSCLDKDVDWRENLVINSGLVELDSASDILYASVEGKEARIYIEIENDDADSISFSINPETVDNVSQVSCEGDLDKAKKEWPLFDTSFVYLYADRVQPHAKYVKSISRLDSRLGDKTANNAVFRFAQAINTNENIAINSLRHKHAIDNSVYRNVGAWINDLMGSDIDVTAEEVEKGKEAKYVYSVTNKENESKNLSPLNMPFGQSYVLPLVLAVLTAPKNSMVLIENPESHLHPSAQGRLGEFIALAAAAGIQIIAETHSDHLMNGVRVACHNHVISNEEIEMDMICVDKNGVEHFRQPIELDENGYVMNWEPGFFDEWEEALKRMIP